jgi:hypothetical protein
MLLDSSEKAAIENKSISTRAQYATLPWKPWMMRYRQSNLVNSLEDCCDREKLHNVQNPAGALKQSNEHSQVVFIDCSLFLIS